MGTRNIFVCFVLENMTNVDNKRELCKRIVDDQKIAEKVKMKTNAYLVDFHNLKSYL